MFAVDALLYYYCTIYCGLFLIPKSLSEATKKMQKARNAQASLCRLRFAGNNQPRYQPRNVATRQRNFSSAPQDTVPLFHVKLAKQNAASTRPPLVIAHGLFGSYMNLTTVAKSFAVERDCYMVDLR